MVYDAAAGGVTFKRSRTRQLCFARGRTKVADCYMEMPHHHASDFMKTRRIVLFVPNLNRGGTERQVALLAQYWGRQGYDVTVATFRSAGAFEQGLREANVRIENLGKGRLPRTFGSLVNLIRLLRQDSNTILYSFLPAANVVAAFAGLVCRNNTIVWGVRSASLPLDRYSAKTRFTYAAEHFLRRIPQRIIVNSRAGLEACARRGYPVERMRVVSNGFETNVFHPDPDARQRQRRALGLGDDEVVIGLPARIDPVKDHETFVKAAALFLASGAKARFVCYGGGLKDLGQSLKKLAEEKGIAEHILWVGEQGDMPLALNALDIATLCSVSEGFPNAVGEAMACGVPCVVTDVGDAAYLVSDTGLVVKPRAPEELALAWRRLIDAPDRKHLGEAARRRIVGHFSVESLGEQTLAVLAEVK